LKHFGLACLSGVVTLLVIGVASARAQATSEPITTQPLVSFKQARALGPEALPGLSRSLRDPESKGNWAKIVTTIAFIGAPGSYEELHDFIWKRFHGEVDAGTMGALSAAVGVMGTIPLDHAPHLMEELERGTEPAYWDSLPWIWKMPKEARNQWFSDATISTLGWTGTAKADSVLKRLSKDPRFASREALIAGTIVTNESVRQKGLEKHIEDALHDQERIMTH